MDSDNVTPLPSEQPSTPTADLQARYDALQQLVGSVMILLLMVSGTVLAWFYWQVKNTNRELEAARPQVANIVMQYQRGLGPAQDEFIRKLTDFGRSHPDFVQILNKYNIPLTNAAPPAGAPAKK